MKKSKFLVLAVLIGISACNGQPDPTNTDTPITPSGPGKGQGERSGGDSDSNHENPSSSGYPVRDLLVQIDRVDIEMQTNSEGDLVIKSLPRKISGKFNFVIDRYNLIFRPSDGESNSQRITDKMCEQVKSSVKFVVDNKDSSYLREMSKKRQEQLRKFNGVRIDLFPTRLNNAQTYIELARLQNIEMNSAPRVVNLPEVLEGTPKLHLSEHAMASQIGDKSELDAQIQAMHFSGPFNFDRYSSVLSSADLICDLRSGEAVIEMELKTSFKPSDEDMETVTFLSSEMQYD